MNRNSYLWCFVFTIYYINIIYIKFNLLLIIDEIFFNEVIFKLFKFNLIIYEVIY